MYSGRRYMSVAGWRGRAGLARPVGKLETVRAALKLSWIGKTERASRYWRYWRLQLMRSSTEGVVRGAPARGCLQ